MRWMEYVEHAPPADLRRHLQCLWILRDDAPDDAIQAIYPDGRCELLAEIGVPLRFHGPDGEIRADQALAFAGQQLGPIRLQATGPVHCIGVRLTAACGGLIAGEYLPALRDRAPDLRTLDAGFAEAFHAAATACVDAESPEPLWALLRQRCAAFAADALVERAVESLDAADGDLRIAALAKALGCSLRTLDSERSAIADAAARHGFNDQAHATHDLLRWTGTTPARLVRALRADPDSGNALRLAAAFVRGRHLTP